VRICDSTRELPERLSHHRLSAGTGQCINTLAHNRHLMVWFILVNLRLMAKEVILTNIWYDANWD